MPLTLRPGLHVIAWPLPAWARAALSVADGSSGACWIDSRGCATNGANADNTYNDNEACTIKVNVRGWGTVTATRFSTENGYDKLIHQSGLGQTVYEGEYSGPYNTLDRVPVMHDHQFTWRSDGSISTGIYSGWTICYSKTRPCDPTRPSSSQLS